MTSTSSAHPHTIDERNVAAILGTWSLQVNGAKTERTEIARGKSKEQEGWRSVKKLGSLIGDEEDIRRRKQLSTIAFRSLWQLWARRDRVEEKLRLRLYNAFVLPVMLYNCGTWAPTSAALESLESHRRRQLRNLLGIRWPTTISNESLYKRCQMEPLDNVIRRLRWQLFGHTLRLHEHTPAQMAMDLYFETSDAKTFPGKPRITLPTLLSAELKKSHIGKLDSKEDLDELRYVASNRKIWKELINLVLSFHLN